MDILNLQGLGSNTLCCLDAGAGDSYPGSGDTWYDLSGNDRDMIVPTDKLGIFNGTPDGRSPSEYFQIGMFGIGNHYQQLIPDASFNFMDPWHTAAANFSVIVGLKTPGTATVALSVISTGVVINGSNVTKGFALHRGNGNGYPNGFDNFKTNKRMYAVYRATSNNSKNAAGVDTGLDISDQNFLMVMASIKNGEQHFRVNDASNNTAASWGDGDTNPSTDAGGKREYPDRSPWQQFGGSGTPSTCQISHLAFFDTALSSTQLQNIYNAFKQYRDPSLP
jgi:hypothetical protein